MAFLAGVPKSRLGEEIGWTTVYYYSKHDEYRRDIWRDQWRSRMNIDKVCDWWQRRRFVVDARHRGKYDRYLDEQHRHRMDREYRAGVHQDVLYKQRDEERWRSEIPAQKRERRQQQADLYNKEIEVIRDEQREDEAERLEQAKIELLHLEAKMREERRRRREEELLELVKDTKEDYVYVPPRGRPEYRTKQRDIDLTRISHDLRQRRDEQADRIKAREQERAKELNTYLRYSESEQKRKERIARMDAADAKEHERERADERATLDQRATERRTRREQEHEEARNKERRQRPIVDYDFDETGKVIHRPLRDQFKEEVKPSAAAVPKEETAKERRQRARQQQAAATAPTDVASSTAPLSAAVEKEVETKSTTVAEKEVETEAIPAPVVLATEAPSASVEVEVAAPSAVASVVVEAEAVAEPSLTVEIPLTPVTPDTPAAAAPESAQ